MLYIGLLALQKQFGLKYLCLVPATLYGPGYHTDDRQMHFIFDLIRKIARGKKAPSSSTTPRYSLYSMASSDCAIKWV